MMHYKHFQETKCRVHFASTRPAGVALHFSEPTDGRETVTAILTFREALRLTAQLNQTLFDLLETPPRPPRIKKGT